MLSHESKPTKKVLRAYKPRAYFRRVTLFPMDALTPNSFYSISEVSQNTTNSSLTCGSSFCPSISLPEFAQDVQRNTVTILVGIFLACIILAIITLYFFLDEIDERIERKEESILSTFLSTAKQLKDRRIWMLIPITILSGLEEGFLFGDYTKVSLRFLLASYYVSYGNIVM